MKKIGIASKLWSILPEHFVERKPLILENLMNASYQGNNPLTLLCIGDVIAILTLATVVIFLSLLIKLFFLKQKPPKQHFKMLFLIRFGNIWSIKIFQKFCKILRCPHLCRAKQLFYCLVLTHCCNNGFGLINTLDGIVNTFTEKFGWDTQQSGNVKT